MVRRLISDYLAADVRARSIVNFRVRYFKSSLFGKFKITKKSVNFFGISSKCVPWF